MKPKILVFSGSARSKSYNKMLASLGAEALAKAGAEPTLIDLRDYPMPIYDGDLEAAEGVPGNAMALKALFKAHHGFLIASPENNASVSSLLKNAIDWVSRAIPGETGKVPYTAKAAALVAAAAGGPAGLRGLEHLRQILTGLGVTVLPEQLGVTRVAEAFDADGALKDAGQQKSLEAIAARLVEVTGRLNAG
jgi:chromate reductase